MQSCRCKINGLNGEYHKEYREPFIDGMLLIDLNLPSLYQFLNCLLVARGHCFQQKQMKLRLLMGRIHFWRDRDEICVWVGYGTNVFVQDLFTTIQRNQKMTVLCLPTKASPAPYAAMIVQCMLGLSTGSPAAADAVQLKLKDKCVVFTANSKNPWLISE